MTREEAIQHFEYGISHDIFAEPVTSYAKMAIAALREQPKWISTADRLPESDGDYLCYCPVLNIGGKDIPHYEVYGFTIKAEEIYDLKMTGHKGAAWYWYDSEYGYCATKSVTHWMPLPEPPEVEA